MKKTLILMIIFSIIPLSYATNDFAYNRLYDGTQPIDGFNYSINVNSSENWLTNIGSLDGVNNTQFLNIAELLNIDTSWLAGFIELIGDDLYCKLTGCTMHGDIDMDSNDIIGVGNLGVNDNVSVGGQINVTGNVIIQDRLFVGLDPSAGQSVINPGDAAIGGNLILASGSINVLPDKYGPAALFLNNGDDSPDKIVFYLNFSGNLNVSTELFCDFVNKPFKENDTLNVIITLFTTEFSTDNIYLAINSFINSSCVIVETKVFGEDNVAELTNVAYVITPQPTFGVIDGGLVLNGINMYYNTNTSSDQFGSYTRENTVQDKPGGNLFADAFTSTDGDLEYVFGTQTGLNNSASFVRNSFCVLSTRNLTTEQKSNITYLHECRQRLSDIGFEEIPNFDSSGVGADLAVENLIYAPKFRQINSLGTGFMDGHGLFTYSIEDTDAATFSLGSVRNLIPVNFTTGFLPGDAFTIFLELFLGNLGIFTNDQIDIGNWNVVSAPSLCDDGECAMGNGGGVGDVSMTATISTLNVNETELSFIYSLFNLIGSGELTVTISNSTASEELFSDTTDNIFLEPELISLSEDWSNQTSLNLTFRCFAGSAAKPTRQCYVDTIKLNGTFTANTTAMVNSFDAEFCASPTRGTDGRCTNSIYFAAENNTWFAKPGINSTGAGGGVFSGSGTSNTITKFLAPTTLGDSNIIDNGSLITLGTNILMQGDTNIGGNSINNVSNINITNNLTISSLTNGSVLFIGEDGLVSEDNSNLFWDGNLGIGTNSPVQDIDVQGNILVDALYFYENNNHVSPNIKRAYYLTSNEGLRIDIGSAKPNKFTVNDDTSTSGTDNVFQVLQQSAGIGGHILMHPSGGVGILTNSPATKLQVVGDSRFGDDSTNYFSINENGSISQTGSGTAHLNQLTLGSNSLDGLSSGDINASTIYYDVLTAKSPSFFCSEDWCSIIFPKYQKTLWIQKNETWGILDIVYNDISYTKQEFWTQVCIQNQITEDICSRLDEKINKLHDKTIADILLKEQMDTCSYSWDGECFEIVKSPSDYANSVSSHLENITYQEKYSCQELNSQLQVIESSCNRDIVNGTRMVWEFNEDCGWNEDDGYWCKEREMR